MWYHLVALFLGLINLYGIYCRSYTRPSVDCKPRKLEVKLMSLIESSRGNDGIGVRKSLCSTFLDYADLAQHMAMSAPSFTRGHLLPESHLVLGG